MKKFFSLKRISLLFSCTVLAALGVAAILPPRTVPLQGTFGTTFTLSPSAIPGVFDNPIEGVGTVPRLGLCTIVIQQVVDFRTDPPSLNPSDWVLTFVNGDQLQVSFTGTGTPDPTDPSFFQLSGTGTVTGGTGRFHNATGELQAPGVAHAETPPGVFPGAGHGAFSLEGYIRFGKD